LNRQKKEHDECILFVEKLIKVDKEYLKKYLLSKNKGVEEIRVYKTICLMDATGSMGGLLESTKN